MKDKKSTEISKKDGPNNGCNPWKERRGMGGKKSTESKVGPKGK